MEMERMARKKNGKTNETSRFITLNVDNSRQKIYWPHSCVTLFIFLQSITLSFALLYSIVAKQSPSSHYPFS